MKCLTIWVDRDRTWQARKKTHPNITTSAKFLKQMFLIHKKNQPCYQREKIHYLSKLILIKRHDIYTVFERLRHFATNFRACALRYFLVINTYLGLVHNLQYSSMICLNRRRPCRTKFDILISLKELEKSTDLISYL